MNESIDVRDQFEPLTRDGSPVLGLWRGVPSEGIQPVAGCVLGVDGAVVVARWCDDGRWSRFAESDIDLNPVVKPKRRVPLGPDDVPPGSEFRNGAARSAYSGMDVQGIFIRGMIRLTWTDLAGSEIEINRPRHRDADGNPTLWERCSKEVDE